MLIYVASKDKTEHATKKTRMDEEPDTDHIKCEDADMYGDNSDDEAGFGSEDIIKVEIWATFAP